MIKCRDMRIHVIGLRDRVMFTLISHNNETIITVNMCYLYSKTSKINYMSTIDITIKYILYMSVISVHWHQVKAVSALDRQWETWEETLQQSRLMSPVQATDNTTTFLHLYTSTNITITATKLNYQQHGCNIHRNSLQCAMKATTTFFVWLDYFSSYQVKPGLSF